MDTTSMLNLAVVVALLLLSISAFVLVCSAVPLLYQLNQTAGAAKRLADTMSDEVGPTMHQVREVMQGVDQIRSITAQRVTEVGHKVEDVAGTFNQAVGSAQKQTSVFGAGIIAGVKAYLTGRNSDASHEKQIPMDKGEANERK